MSDPHPERLLGKVVVTGAARGQGAAELRESYGHVHGRPARWRGSRSR
ncbi:hypothetical protein ACWGJV_21640 [Streptomyces tendae]